MVIPATQFNVRTYGAVGDGIALDSPAINRAIEAAVAAGGGMVVFPAGVFLSFSIRLQSYVHLFLGPGSVLLAADSPSPGEDTGYASGSYDLAEEGLREKVYQDYGHTHWHNSLLWGEDLSDLSITGPGKIHGKGLSTGGSRNMPPPRFTEEQHGVGNKVIALKNCRRVTLRDFALEEGGHIGVLLSGTDNVTISNLTIDTNRDGINIDCCRNIRVSDCLINSPWNDGICLKSSLALGFSRATENVTISNCQVTGRYELGSLLAGTYRQRNLYPGTRATGRIKCGTESNGDFRNITIVNCTFEGCEGLALESVDGGSLFDITIANIIMRSVTSCPLFLRLGARLRGPGNGTAGELKRILISNLVSSDTDSKVCSVIAGLPGHLIEDVKLSNIFIEHAGGHPEYAPFEPPELAASYPEPAMFGPLPAQGFFLRHVRNIELSHVEVRPKAADIRPTFYLKDVHQASFTGVTARGNLNAFHLEDVTDVNIFSSRTSLARQDKLCR